MKPKKYKVSLRRIKLKIDKLPEREQLFIRNIIDTYRFSFQEQKQLIEMAIDLHMWQEPSLETIWNAELDNKYQGKQLKKAHLNHIKKYYQTLQNQPTDYSNQPDKTQRITPKITVEEKNDLGFGLCPVASPKTRCCNLLTLDAVQSCGFDCSYCSIQSFYNENKIVFDSTLKDKLQNIQLDPDQFYHIGTGQSSDSLMWGNYNGILDDLIQFAQKHPNIILEFKTKSDNIRYLLETELPPNILVTWSLNPQTIIDQEEHLSASLQNRLNAAKMLHDKGVLVGFHFHPIIHYKGYREDYGEIFNYLLDNFNPDKVVLISFGTLTFIKPVIKQIRNRDFHSKILQIPMVDANGKKSYPLSIKKELFKFAYDSLSPWHNRVYFYLCMEDHSLWKEVFGYEYPTNETFELDMKLHYMDKIEKIKSDK